MSTESAELEELAAKVRAKVSYILIVIGTAISFFTKKNFILAPDLIQVFSIILIVL